MDLTGITHRDELFEIACRWLGDRPRPDDGRRVTAIFVLDALITAPVVRAFLARTIASFEPGVTHWHRFRTKDALRHALVEICPADDGRTRELFRAFAERPEEFFPGTPVELLMATRADGLPVGMFRIKRIKRIAEKASRRLADRLAGEIRRAAEQIASERATRVGLPLSQLVSPPEAMIADFVRAEQRVARAIHAGSLVPERDRLRIDDVLGVKLIGSWEDLERAERAILADPAATVVAREEHRGTYNDVNLVVELPLPSPAEIVASRRGFAWTLLAGHGLLPDELARVFPGYVEAGARTIRCEVILTTLSELIESEFGRSIHEERILEQRLGAAYSGPIAQNAAFLIEYLLTLAVAPTVTVDELPVKLWGRYLPERYSRAMWDLFCVAPAPECLGAFLGENEPPDEEGGANF
ncbi:MAG: hypothetical protein Kow0062_04400 [Acidobacteriota bacterium]